ncbi:MAG: DUF1049 domain-containing protein [Rickettsiales bacterium]|nr:DUF1049 domain-containing protein [Rickettsiales bacterium]
MLNFLKSTIRTIKTILLSLILICLVIFMVNNRQIITLQLFPLPIEIDTRVFMLIFFFFLLGMFFGMLACSKSLLTRIFTGFKDKQKIKNLEKEIAKK